VSRILRRIALTLCLVALARVCPAAPIMLSDSTMMDQWTLPNGLRVVARHVPRASAVSVTWGYRFGQDADPRDELGWATLLAEVAFTAPAGDTPERTRDEMESLRPLGWGLRVNRRQTLFTETAAPAQVAGMLHQIAGRMRGVQVTPENLRRSLATVRAVLDQQSRGVGEAELYWQLREHALGVGPEELTRVAEARKLARETPRSVQAALARIYVPANGVLVLVGDFSRLDVYRVVAEQFGGLPGGEPLPELPPSNLKPGEVMVERPDIKAPVALVGLFSPVMEDTLQPQFYMSLLVLGSQVKAQWGAPEPPLGSRFQYSLLDDPDVVRFFPKLLPGDEANPRAVSDRVSSTLLDVIAMTVEPEVFATYRDNVLWLLGGSLPPRLLETMRRDPAALNLLCATSASRRLWGDEAFWSEYRRRFGDENAINPGLWNEWLVAQRLRATLLVVPTGTGKGAAR